VPEENNVLAIGEIADGTKTVKTVSKTKFAMTKPLYC